MSKREEEKSESYFALHCHHHVSILEGRHYVEKEENDKVKVTWSSKREGGAAVTNLFIWFYYKRKVDLCHFLTTSTTKREEKREKEQKRNKGKRNKRKRKERKENK